MLSVFCAPSRYVQGPSATRSLGCQMLKLGLGSRVFILSGKAARQHLDSVWKQSFQESGQSYQVIDFAGECSRSEIDRVKAAGIEYGAEVIVGAGGGKVLDTARAVASELDLPVVNCPTVASSDAPCSALSVVYSDDGQFDKYLFYKRNPDLVLVDTTMVVKAPARLLSAGMGDALATWFEARAVKESGANNQVGGKPTKSATNLARLCYETLIEDGPGALLAVKTGQVNDHLEQLIEANTLLSGLGFESGGLAVAHSVHNGLTTIEATHEYYHGEKVAFGTIVQLVMEKRSQSELTEVIQFCKAVNLPVCLWQLGIVNPTKEIVETIAERTVCEGETAHNEPFPVDSKLVVECLWEADAIGRKHL